MRIILKLIRKIIKIIVSLILVISVSIVAIGTYITFIERNLLVEKKYNITVDEVGGDTLRVVQFTDTQLGEYYTLDDLERAVKKINKLDVDIVVFTGDLIDNASIYDDLFNVADVLKKIEANIGKYAIYGNHDYGGGAVRYYEDIMSKGGFTVLKNSSTSIEFNGQKLNIFGGDDALMGDYSLEETIDEISEEDINLLLIHEPDLIDDYSDYPIDLALSGHSHGGQVYLPFYGPVKKNVLSEKYNRGFFEMDNQRQTKFYVNTGLGNTKVPFRFLTIPQIAVFDVKI